MQFSIKKLLSSDLYAGNVDFAHLPFAALLSNGFTSRLQSEIDQQLNHDYQGQALLLKIFAAAYDVPHLRVAQDARRDLSSSKESLNDQIFSLASKLAELLRDREKRESQARLSAVLPSAIIEFELTYSSDSVVALIDRAAELETETKRLGYLSVIQPELTWLETRIDNRYWPDQASVIDAVASFANERRYSPSDDLGLIADKHRQRNDAGDFLRLLSFGLGHIRGLAIGGDETGDIVFPDQFELSAECLADLSLIFNFGEISAKEARQFLRRHN